MFLNTVDKRKLMHEIIIEYMKATHIFFISDIHYIIVNTKLKN